MGKSSVGNLPAKPEIRTATDNTIMRVIPELAEQIGLNESIALLQIAYWIRIGGEHVDGMWWTYQSVRDMKSKGFGYWSVATINRTVVKLVKDGYIHEGNYNKKKYDKTRWLALNLDKIKTLKGVTVTIGDVPYQNETTLSQNDTRSNQFDTRSAQNETTIPEITTETTTKIKDKDSVAPIATVDTQPASPNVAATSAAQSEKQSVIDAEKIIVAAFDEPNDQQRLEQFYASLKGKAPDDTTKAKIAECLKSYPYEQICDAIQFVHNAPQPKPGVVEVLERWEFEAAMDNPAKAAKPKAPKSSKGREPNPLYDALAQHLFGVSPHDKTAIKAINGRVVVLLPFAKEHVKPEELPLFVAWYRAKYPNLDLPRGTGTFAMKWTDFKAGGGNNVPVPIISQPSVPALAKAPIDSDFEAYVMRQRAKLKEEKPS